jgi:hypothetical protein
MEDAAVINHKYQNNSSYPLSCINASKKEIIAIDERGFQTFSSSGALKSENGR